VVVEFNADAIENGTPQASLQLTLAPSKMTRAIVQHFSAQLELPDEKPA
jgi:hypothetical protein